MRYNFLLTRWLHRLATSTVEDTEQIQLSYNAGGNMSTLKNDTDFLKKKAKYTPTLITQFHF